MGELVFADGFEDALIGIGRQFDKEFAVYDYVLCVNILMQRDGMTSEEAIEFMEYNVVGAYVDQTHQFLWKLKRRKSNGV